MQSLKSLMVVAVAVTTLSTAAPSWAAGDAAAGERVFNRCKACHVVDQETNRVGPHLVGIFGRAAGAVEGFRYSKSMAESGVVWDEENMAAFLADPRGFMPNNRMAFPGLRKQEDIANVIAYMREVTAVTE